MGRFQLGLPFSGVNAAKCHVAGGSDEHHTQEQLQVARSCESTVQDVPLASPLVIPSGRAKYSKSFSATETCSSILFKPVVSSDNGLARSVLHHVVPHDPTDRHGSGAERCTLSEPRPVASPTHSSLQNSSADESSIPTPGFLGKGRTALCAGSVVEPGDGLEGFARRSALSDSRPPAFLHTSGNKNRRFTRRFSDSVRIIAPAQTFPERHVSTSTFLDPSSRQVAAPRFHQTSLN